jgi:hypothetical protein
MIMNEKKLNKKFTENELLSIFENTTHLKEE